MTLGSLGYNTCMAMQFEITLAFVKRETEWIMSSGSV